MTSFASSLNGGSTHVSVDDGTSPRGPGKRYRHSDWDGLQFKTIFALSVSRSIFRSLVAARLFPAYWRS